MINEFYKALLLFIISGVIISCNKQPTEKPNVLFIIADDLGTRLGCYDDPMAKTPHIDQLAQKGVAFTNAYCQLPTCGPSRASMLSGLYPWETGIINNKIYLRDELPDIVTLPQLLQQNNYFTARVGKVFHLNIPNGIGTDGGDDTLSWNLRINSMGLDIKEEYEKKITFAGNGGIGTCPSWLAADIPDKMMSDGVVTTDAISIMEDFHPDKTGKPLFLAVGYYRPHPPMVAPKEYFKWYPKEKIKTPFLPENDRGDIPECAFEQKQSYFNFLPDTSAINYTQARYSSVSFVDAQVGLLMDALKQNGLDDNTVVVFVGDQGFHLGEHGHWHKTTLFEEGVHVPLIIAEPKSKMAGMKCSSSMVELVDIYPTISDMLGLELPHKMPGISLLPQLNDVIVKGKQAAVSQVRHASGFSIRTPKYRYTEWQDESNSVELYDHDNDPKELTNIESNPDQQLAVSQLKRELHNTIGK
jgi:iduronate 2-sulfatase